MTISIPTDLLKAALICASTEETRPYLCGVYLSTSGHVVATDGHRMFVARLAEAPPADVIIPSPAIAAALKLAGARAKEIEIDLAANRIGQIQYTPIDGTFPDWRRVVPTGEEKPDDNPERNDGPEHAHFNHAYIGDMAKMAGILCGTGKLSGPSVLHPRTASGPCLVTFGEREDCFAVLMPLRRVPIGRAPSRQAAQIRNFVMAG